MSCMMEISRLCSFALQKELGFDRVYVKSQERHWSAANPKSIHQVLLCDVRVGVWCAMSANRINGPVSFPSL
jgi:hypothetical protein